MIDPVSDALDAAGLDGWRGVVSSHPESQDRVAVLHSPDYDPAKETGRMVVARAADADRALALAIADAVAEKPGDPCPVCSLALKPADICATDVDLGTCHAACLEGSPMVDLETGAPFDGPVDTYRYDSLLPPKAKGGTEVLA